MRSTSSSPSNNGNKAEIIDFESTKRNFEKPESVSESMLQMLNNGEITEEEYAAYIEYYGDDVAYSGDKSEPASADAPKIKLETNGSWINAYALGTTIMIAVGLAIFFCGVAFKLLGLSVVGVIAIAISILFAVFHYRTNEENERRKRDKTVERDVESFKIDLYKTLVGYDLHVSQDEIDNLIEQYRIDRIAAETSFASLNPIEMLKFAVSKTKEVHDKSGESDSQANRNDRSKKNKRNKKKDKKKSQQQVMFDAISGMSDEEIINTVTKND